MKTRYLFITALLLIIPLGVLAADPNVLTVTAENSGSTVNYSGTTEDDVHAVMCKLYDANDEEIDMLSSEVNNNAFTGSFTDIANGDYTVGCARYEGGDVITADVSVATSTDNDTNKDSNKAKDNKASSNPITSDNIALFIIILVVCIVGITGSVMYIKKRSAVKQR